MKIEIKQPEMTTIMNGYLNITTLGSKKLALSYTGQLITPKGHFSLRRTLIMDYHFHPENNAPELNYQHSNISTLDDAPDSVLYHDLMTGRPFIIFLTRFNNRAWLISGLTAPLYVCRDNR